MRRGGLRFVALFALIFAALQLVLVKTRAPVADWLVAAPAAQTLALALPSDHIVASANQIYSKHVRLNILPGCEGTELFFLLLAGVAAFPVSWRAKLLGLAIGLPLVFALNIARIALLYVTVRDHPAQFELVHSYIAPTAFVACLGVFFWWWTARAIEPADAFA
jgi:exosortase family protein XrtM